MGILKQLLTLKLHPSGWPVIACMIMVGLIVGLTVGAPITLSFGLASLGIYLFRVQSPIIPIDKDVMLAPVSGKISNVSTLATEVEWILPSQQYKKIGIRCDLLFAASLHAPISMKIIGKKIVADESSRQIILTAETIDVAEIRTKSYVSEKFLLVFATAIPYWFPVCDVEINDTLVAGQNFGFLTFGGQVDLYVSNQFLTSRIGKQTCIAGETILARGV